MTALVRIKLFVYLLHEHSFLDVESLTQKTGNFKKFSVFISMLKNGLLKVIDFILKNTTIPVEQFCFRQAIVFHLTSSLMKTYNN